MSADLLPNSASQSIIDSKNTLRPFNKTVPINNVTDDSVYPSAPTIITSVNSDTALAPANTSRTGLIISNDSTSKLYVLIDESGTGTASGSDYTYVLAAGATLELPVNNTWTPTARIRGFWSSANGTAAVTQIAGAPTPS